MSMVSFNLMRQLGLFHATISDEFKCDLNRLSKDSGHDFGVFFTTSGKLKLERVNPTRQYDYIYETQNHAENRKQATPKTAKLSSA